MWAPWRMEYVRAPKKDSGNIFSIKLESGKDLESVTYLTKQNIDKTPEGEVLDYLGLTKMCCRRHMLTHVDIE